MSSDVALTELAEAVRESEYTLDEWSRMLRKLRSRSRRVVVLRVLYGLSYTEIADRLGVGLSKVRIRQIYMKSLDQLRNDLRGM